MAEPLTPSTRALLRDLHAMQLRLHKLLMDEERARYEAMHGAVPATQFLQLLIADPGFAWLRNISSLLADIDGVTSLRRPGSESDAEALVARMRALLDPDPAGGEFHRKYDAHVQENPDVLILHCQIRKVLDRPVQ